MLVFKQKEGKVFLTAMAVLMLLVFTSCSRKMVFQKSDAVPAAEGKVKVKKDDNNNYTINIKVRNLATPDRLTPSRKYYIVWMESKKEGLQNLGQIKTSSGLFTSGLKASFSTSSSLKPQRIFITAEDQLNAPYPGSQLVLTTSTF